MKKKEKVILIQNILNKYFPNPTIPLLHKNPYTLLIAVLLSAQTTDKCVNKITDKLFKIASSPSEMIKIPFDKIKSIINPCGLAPTKAKAIIALSHILIEKHKSIVPKAYADLEKLPGVGHKTAGVVLAQAYNIDTFPVDTHIMRCAHRWNLSTEKTPIKIENDLKKIFPKNTWKKLHLQIIYFARNYCKAIKHTKEKCPICSIIS